MTDKKTISFLLILLTAATGMFAAEPLVLTEEAAVALALEQNFGLQSSRLDLEGSTETEKNNWNAFLPDLTASAAAYQSEEFLSDTGYITNEEWGAYGKLDASLNINYAAIQGIASNKLALDSQEITYETSEDNLIVNVKKQFYKLVADREKLDTERKNLELAEKRYDQTKVNYENGLASELDVLEAQNSYESMRPSYTTTKTSYETQLMTFKTLLGLDLEKEILIEGSLKMKDRDSDKKPDFEAEDLIDAFLMNRLDVQQAMKSVEIKENTEKITAIGNRTPTLSLSGEWRNTTSNMDDPDWYDYTTVTLALSMPLNGFIPGSSETVSIHNARRETEKAELDLQETILNAEEDIRTILMQLDSYRENMEITELSVELAEKTYEMTEYAYKQGTREILDVEDSQNKLLDARQDLVDSRYNFLSGLLDLEIALNADRESILAVVNK